MRRDNQDERRIASPYEVYASLLDQGTYHCSIRTMYRILHEHDEIKERHRQLSHPVYQKPELLAEGPNQVWSWCQTALKNFQVAASKSFHLVSRVSAVSSFV